VWVLVGFAPLGSKAPLQFPLVPPTFFDTSVSWIFSAAALPTGWQKAIEKAPPGSVLVKFWVRQVSGDEAERERGGVSVMSCSRRSYSHVA